MNVHTPLENRAARATALGVVLILCGWLLVLVLSDFLVRALTNDVVHLNEDGTPGAFIAAPFLEDGAGINADVLTAAARYIPSSPRLQIRLTEFETREGLWSDAEFHARRAIDLSPYDYRPYEFLATIQQHRQQIREAQQSVRAALRLFPGDVDSHWQLATLLLIDGRLTDSLPEFRAADGDPAVLRAALDLLWEESRNDVGVLRAVTPDIIKDRLVLADFLLEKSRPVESADVIRQTEPKTVLADHESSTYLNSLIHAGHVALAHDLWRQLMVPGTEASEDRQNVVWNGGFESDILVDFAHFNWSISPNDYAQVSIDSNTAHTGRRSLRMDFLGRETTRLDIEITQLLVVRPGARYRVRYYVKTENLTGPGGLRVVLSPRTASPAWIAASDPASIGSNDWQEQAFEFTAAVPDVVIAIKQRPMFSYEDPTRGTVWFDDFEVAEVGGDKIRSASSRDTGR